MLNVPENIFSDDEKYHIIQIRQKINHTNKITKITKDGNFCSTTHKFTGDEVTSLASNPVEIHKYHTKKISTHYSIT